MANSTVHRSPFSMWSFSSLWSCRDSDEGASACERPASHFSGLASVRAGVHLSCGSSLLPQSIKYLTVATICLTLSVWPSGHLRSNLLPLSPRAHVGRSITLQISPDATEVSPDATTATIFLKKSLLSGNCFAYKAVPSLADNEKQGNHLWHLAQVMHRSASHPFSVHQAGQTHRSLAWRQTMAWDKLWCNSTQKKLSVQSPENWGLWRFLNLWWSQAQLANPPLKQLLLWFWPSNHWK